MSGHPVGAPLARIPVLLLGCGGVGQQLLSHIVATRQLHAGLGVRLSVVGVCDSASLVAPRGESRELPDDALAALWRHKAAGGKLRDLALSAAEVSPVPRLPQLAAMADGGVLVDCTASDTALLLAEAVQRGACVVLANKKPITASLESYDAITAVDRRFRNESTVGAGLPVMAALARLRSAGDIVTRIAGALSGTLGYVMSGLQEGRRLSEVVWAAKALGYTEPDPRDDLSGLDVGRKALIMARSLGWRLEMRHVEIESLYPPSMDPSQMSVAEFLDSGLPQLDAAMCQRAEAAAAKGAALRYAATLEDGRCSVGLTEVPLNSPLGRLQGSDNLVEISSRCYKAAPLVLQGAGAGNDTTAAGVLADILDLRNLFVK